MTSVRIKYNPLPAQKVFHDDMESNILAFLGGLGSGKSHGLMMKLLKLSWVNKGYAGGLLCPTVQDFKRDMLPLFEELFQNHNLQNVCRYHKGDTCFIFPWNDKPLYVFSAERPIAGPNLAYCGINEPSLIKETRINEMLRRVRAKDAPALQRCMAGTPEDVHGYLQDFVEKHQKSGKLKLVHSSTKDNRFIDAEYYQHLKDTLDPQAFKVFAEGELIFIGGNQFYYSFSRDNYTNIVLDETMPLFINIDFNVGAMSATVAQQHYLDGKKISVFVDEILLSSDSADTYAMINAIKARYTPKMLNNMVITCDFSGKARKTTGPSDVKVLRSAFSEDQVRYRATGNIRFRKRQLLVNGLLHHKQILINADKCPILKRDLAKVQQREDFSKDKRNPDLTHMSDTLDYYIDFEYEQTETRFHQYRAR